MITILHVFAFVLFVLAAVIWTPLAEPHRWRLIAAGLAFWVAAALVPLLGR